MNISLAATGVGGGPIHLMFLGSHIFNLFLLYFSKGENIGCKAAVTVPTCFFIVTCSWSSTHTAWIYICWCGEKAIPSLWTCRAAGCRDCEGTRTSPGDLGQVWRTLRPPNLREDAFAVFLLFSTNYPVRRIPVGILGSSFVSWDPKEFRLIPPTSRCCSHSIRGF